MIKIETIKKIYKVLLYILAALVVIIAIGTIIGLVRGRDITETNQIETSAAVYTDDIRIFTGLGRLRIPLSNQGVLILSIAFPYQASDIAFTEELAGKIPELKTIAQDYFSNLALNEVTQINEEAAKAEILSRFNNTLRLGQISALYFNDMLIMDVN